MGCSNAVLTPRVTRRLLHSEAAETVLSVTRQVRGRPSTAPSDMITPQAATLGPRASRAAGVQCFYGVHAPE